ncbi:hypothetical protein C0991_007278 [Blastosporella zonata]|nr:hypothetical protein C0991_007278 [Blastosporella zonata]
MIKTEAPFSRAVALFGLYTFYFTQPHDTAPRLYNIAHIPIPLGLVVHNPIHIASNRLTDQLASLKALPSSLNVEHLQPLQPHVSYILSVLFRDKVFFITPCSDAGSLNPRDLPREFFVEEGTILQVENTAPKKKGRPTKRDKVKKAKLGLDSLDKWLHDTPPPLPLSAISPPPSFEHNPALNHPLLPTLRRYHTEKTHILDSIGPSTNAPLSFQAGMVMQKSNQFILERLKAAEGLFSAETSLVQGNESIGLARVERAVNELGETNSVGRLGGALNLLEGAGNT